MRSERAERGAGVAVVLTIPASAIAAGTFAVLRLDRAALVADRQHARSDAIVTGGVVLSALAVALGGPYSGPDRRARDDGAHRVDHLGELADVRGPDHHHRS